MESCEARFVTMVMDRLHAVEEENIVLAARLTALESGLCLKDDLMTFNNGQTLLPAFGEGGDRLYNPTVFSWCSDPVSAPIDALHANAPAFYGPISFDFGFLEWPHKLNLGQLNKFTTVGEYLQGMNNWCQRWVAAEPDTSVTQSMQETFMGWEYSRMQHPESGTVYCLR